MKRRVAVVIAVDGLRAAALGSYGNTGHATPALDELASESVVVEWMLCTSTELPAFYDAAWGEPPLASQLIAAGGVTTLITDDPEVAAQGEAAKFDDVVLVELPSPESSESIAETALARLFAVAAEQIAIRELACRERGTEAGPASLYWIHTRGLTGPWDAPPELRAAQLDEDDPEPPTFLDSPRWESIADNDAMLAFQVAYAAQVAVLDHCVAEFLELVQDASQDDELLIALVGTSGFALGEHGVAGREDHRLFTECLHIPCLIRPPHAAPAPPRWPSLASPHDIHQTLACWLRGLAESPRSEAADLLSPDYPSRMHLVVEGRAGERAVRTPHWMLRACPQPTQDAGQDLTAPQAVEGYELYVKPDDRWDANEVARRCPEVVEQLREILRSQ